MSCLLTAVPVHFCKNKCVWSNGMWLTEGVSWRNKHKFTMAATKLCWTTNRANSSIAGHRLIKYSCFSMRLWIGQDCGGPHTFCPPLLCLPLLLPVDLTNKVTWEWVTLDYFLISQIFCHATSKKNLNIVKATTNLTYFKPSRHFFPIKT